MFSIKELRLMSKKIDDEIEAVRIDLSSGLKVSPSPDFLPCIHMGDNFIYASYFSKSNPKVSVKITPYDIIGDDNLILLEKDYCRYLQLYIISKSKEHYDF